MTRGNNRNTVFKSDADYSCYLQLLRRFKLELNFDLYHYCLMPSHVHLLIQTKKSEDFSLFMKKINLAYFHYFNRNYGWVGHFWQDRFKSQPVGKDNYFIQCGKYIELNPIRKNLVERPESWRYSSYNYYARGAGNDLVTEDFLYEELQKTDVERQKKYRKMMIDEIIITDYHRRIWGSTKERYNERDKESKYFKRRNEFRVNDD